MTGYKRLFNFHIIDSEIDDKTLGNLLLLSYNES